MYSVPFSNENLYLPPAHLKALRLNTHIVVGGRGVGKSFLASALQSAPLRGQLGATFAELLELQDIDVFLGFGNDEAIENYPNNDVFSNFLDQNGDPYDLWRAVILRWVARRNCVDIPGKNWQATVDWLKQKPEDAARLMQFPRNWKGLIIFDALDRTSSNWRHRDDIVRGLMRAVLWLKSFPGLYAKAFLREEQAERTIFNFPDSSKILATKTKLNACFVF